MKKIKFLFFMLVTVSLPVFAEMKIAVLDYQIAMLESDPAKKYAAEAEKRFSPTLKQIQSLEEEIKSLEAKLQSQSNSLSASEKGKVENDLQYKIRDFQNKSQQLNADKSRADQVELQKLKPNLDKAVKEVIDQGNYDLVLDKSAVVDVKKSYDITNQVIERLNRLSK